MELIVSFLALVISLIAMWIGSTSIRKADGDMNSFLLNARKELGSVKTEIDKQVTSMEARVNALDQLVSALRTETGNSNKTILNLKSEIAALRNDLGILDESIPKQYRHPAPRAARPQIHQ